MSKEDVFVGIKNPSVITKVINNYNEAVKDFDEGVNALLETRKKFDIAKVEFLDGLMDFVQSYAAFNQEMPVVKFKTIDHVEAKKRLKEKVARKKQEFEQKNAKNVAQAVKQEVSNRQRPSKPSDDLARARNFRKDLENLNKQISNLIY